MTDKVLDTVGSVAIPESLAALPPTGWGVMRQAVSGEILGWDEQMERLTGWSEAEVVGRPALELVHPDDRRGAITAWIDMLQRGRVGPVRYRRQRKDGTYIFLEVNLENRLEGSEGGYVVARNRVAVGEPPAPAAVEVARRPRHGSIHETISCRILEWDRNMEGMTGWPRRDIVGRNGAEIIHPDDQTIAIEAWMEMLEDGRSTPRRWRSERHDGTWQWQEATLENLLNDADHGYVLVDIIDVTEEMAAREALEDQELRLNRLAQLVPTGLLQLDRDLRVVYANDRLHEILGASPCDALTGLLRGLVPADQRAVTETVGHVLESGDDEEVTVDVRLRTGEPRRCHFSIRALLDRLGQVTGVVACVSDVTETARRLVELEMDLIQHAVRDPLTGLGNRMHLLNRLDEAVAGSRRSGDTTALLLVDLHEFKAVNDTLGHTAGDDVLRAMADRLRALARSTDAIARTGGDVFALLMEEYIDPDHPARTAEHVLNACAQPIEVDGRPLRLSASVGIATTTSSPEREELLRDADLALHRAKAAGPGTYEFFEPEMHLAAVARVELETSLRQALERDELFVVYQPIHDLTTGAVSSVEALVRWRHPTRGIVSPADFIPLAEATGLVVPIGRWVLGEACARAAGWARHPGLGRPRISINLSARQLASPNLLDDVTAALEHSGLPPTQLILEITESVLMEATNANTGLLAELKSLGIALAIDDFGTGYSSLAYLERLPVDILKVDKAFVDRVAEGGRHATLIHTILTLSRGLGLLAVAEGIETEDQLRALRQLACPYGQGFLFSRPVEDPVLAHAAPGRIRGRAQVSTSQPTAATRPATPGTQ